MTSKNKAKELAKSRKQFLSNIPSSEAEYLKKLIKITKDAMFGYTGEPAVLWQNQLDRLTKQLKGLKK